jgi:hypothetical protein
MNDGTGEKNGVIYIAFIPVLLAWLVCVSAESLLRSIKNRSNV